MPTRREFVATTMLVALGASAGPALTGSALETPKPSSRPASGEAHAGEMARYNALAALAQSVPFPS